MTGPDIDSIQLASVCRKMGAFYSIDDNEMANLKLLGDKNFGSLDMIAILSGHCAPPDQMCGTAYRRTANLFWVCQIACFQSMSGPASEVNVF